MRPMAHNASGPMSQVLMEPMAQFTCAKLDRDVFHRKESKRSKGASMEVTTIALRKGGVAKTATTVNLAAALAILGKKTLVIDLDPQKNASKRLGFQYPEDGSQDFYSSFDAITEGTPMGDIAVSHPHFREKLWVCPAVDALEHVGDLIRADYYQLPKTKQNQITAEQHERARLVHLSRSLSNLSQEGFEHVLIDTPPRMGFHLTSALYASDWLMIPVFPDSDSLDAMDELVDYASYCIEKLNLPLLLIGVLLSGTRAGTNLAQAVKSHLIETFGADGGGGLFKTQIPMTVKVPEAGNQGKTIFEYLPKHEHCRLFTDLAEEFLRRIEVMNQATKQAVGNHG